MSAWARSRAVHLLRSDGGSILPLVLGYATLTIAAVFVGVCATSLHLAQTRLDGLADAAALAGADGFTISIGGVGDGGGDAGGGGGGDDGGGGDAGGHGAVATLHDRAVLEQATAIVDAAATDAQIVSARTPDGVSARVTLTTVWHPPLVALFVPDGVRLESTSTSRTVLD